MRFIITGGTGMLGRPLSAALAQANHDVIVLSRNPARAKGMPANVRVEKWDAKTPAGWGSLINNDTIIINLAGANIAGDGFFPTRWDEARKEMLLQSRLNVGKAVADAVSDAAEKPLAVMQASGVGYYGSTQSAAVMDESAPAGSDFLAQVCVKWEASTASVAEHGVRHIILRTGIVLSSHDGALQRILLPYRLFAGGPFGSGKQYYSWIHLDDEIEAIKFLAENPMASGAYNLCVPEPLTNAAFGKAVGRALRRPSLIPVPGFAMRAMFGEVATVVLDGQRAVPKALLALDYNFRFTDAAEAVGDIVKRGI